MIWDLVKNALATIALTYPVSAGSYVSATPGGGLPATYIVYRLISMGPEQHADDAETLRYEVIQVSVYSQAGLAGLPDVIGAMTAAGFMFTAGRELDFDPATRHYGLALDFEYLEDLED
jgi:hypothetical protein